MINLYWLTLLEAVARTGNVTSAAKALAISQPAVSKQLRQLERSLKTKLYTRHARGIALTPAGEVAADHARRIVRIADSLPAALADLNSLRTGHLRVGATPAIGTYLLPDLLLRFRAKYPGVALDFTMESPTALARQVADRHLDVALLEGDSPSLADVETTRFLHEPLVPIASDRDPLATRKKIRREHLLSAGLIAWSATPAAGLTLPIPEAVKRAVMANLGVALLPRFTVRHELAEQKLIELHLTPTPESFSCYSVLPAGTAKSKPLIAFLYLLKHAVRGSLPSQPPKLPRTLPSPRAVSAASAAVR